jgi:hypothetical protein
MADTIAGIATLVSLTTQTSFQISRLVKEWKDTPTQVQLLADEVESSSRVILQLKTLYHQLNAEDHIALSIYADSISLQMKRVELIWQELDKIL